ncbi:MAG TPA: hypothetical protein VN761_04800 [Candidatus Polarisedimenticolia bacterium]|nr:hypothetical protein [Candidatus Polarisedimenticolia bacterium]
MAQDVVLTLPMFSKVSDGRKRPIRGLWVRAAGFYAQLRIDNVITGVKITGVKKTGRLPLVYKDSNP